MFATSGTDLSIQILTADSFMCQCAELRDVYESEYRPISLYDTKTTTDKSEWQRFFPTHTSGTFYLLFHWDACRTISFSSYLSRSKPQVRLWCQPQPSMEKDEQYNSKNLDLAIQSMAHTKRSDTLVILAPQRGTRSIHSDTKRTFTRYRHGANEVCVFWTVRALSRRNLVLPTLRNGNTDVDFLKWMLKLAVGVYLRRQIIAGMTVSGMQSWRCERRADSCEDTRSSWAEWGRTCTLADCFRALLIRGSYWEHNQRCREISVTHFRRFLAEFWDRWRGLIEKVSVFSRTLHAWTTPMRPF